MRKSSINTLERRRLRFREKDNLAQGLTQRMWQTILHPRADSPKPVHLPLKCLGKDFSVREMKRNTGKVSSEYSGHQAPFILLTGAVRL